MTTPSTVQGAPLVTGAPPKPTRARVSRVVLALVAAVAIVVSGFAVYDSAANAIASVTYPPKGAFATLSTGGHLHYICAGAGDPSLALLAGFGGDVLDWAPVIPAFSTSRRVCAFDRLGQGWSDPAPTQATSDAMAAVTDQIAEAVEAAGITRPIIVGHSLGGAFAQVYAARHEVAGLVLVDGLTTGVADAVLARLGTYETLAPVAEFGLLRPIAGTLVDPVYPADLRDEMFALRSRSTSLVAVAHEGALANRSARVELGAAEEALRSGRTPVLVIAAGATDVPQLPARAFTDAQRAFVERVPGAEFMLVPGAHHYVMAEQPQVVASLIQTWAAAQVAR